MLGLSGFSKADDENDAMYKDDEPDGFIVFHAVINGNITKNLSYSAGLRNFGSSPIYDPYYHSKKYVNIERLDQRIWAGLTYTL